MVVGFYVYGIIGSVVQPTYDRVSTTFVTVNSTMDDNTHGVPTGWDNHYTDNRIANLDNAGIANHFLQDNDNGICYWFQDLAVGSLGSTGVTSATVSFAYQVSDNSGLEGVAGSYHRLKVILQRPGGDNVTIWENLSHVPADNATWHTQDNTITTSINATGTYILYLFDNAYTTGVPSANDNVVVRWDDASLSITISDYSTGENAYININTQAHDVWGLVPLILIVVVAAAIIGVIVGFGGRRET